MYQFFSGKMQFFVSFLRKYQLFLTTNFQEILYLLKSYVEDLSL